MEIKITANITSEQEEAIRDISISKGVTQEVIIKDAIEKYLREECGKYLYHSSLGD